MKEKEILAGYRSMRRSVERERRRLERTGGRKSERYLLRSRLVDDLDPLSLAEFLRELRRLDSERRRTR